MEYDNRFHPAEGNDIEDYDINNKNSYTLQNLKSLDKRFHKHKKTVPVETESGNTIRKQITIEYYSCGPSGSNIRNAQTGVYTQDIVGSKNEDLYFKVTVADGSLLTLFYDSPEQYERHQREKLSQETKDLWFKKRLLFEKMSR